MNHNYHTKRLQNDALRLSGSESPDFGVRRRCLSFTVSALSLVLLGIATPATAQPTIPTSDTEDAELGSMPVSAGRIHPFLSLDVRNGDYARGSYDDDASNLDRVPIHGELGLAVDLHRSSSGVTDAFLLVESSNGFHSPSANETSSPRFWYESNNLVGIAVRPVGGLTMALTYTNKRSPNGVAGITHEASLGIAYESASGIGQLHPTFSLTGRPTAGRGTYAQVGIEPQWKLGRSEGAPELSLPLHIAVGWGGFYQVGTGTIKYGNVGLALTKPLHIAGKDLAFRSEILALLRDSTLRNLDGDNANHAAVVPLATVGISTAF